MGTPKRLDQLAPRTAPITGATLIGVREEGSGVKMQKASPLQLPISTATQIALNSVIDGNEPYTKILSGYTDTILHAEHGLLHVNGLRVCTPAGDAVEVLEKYSGTTVEVFSNILLDGHLLTIY